MDEIFGKNNFQNEIVVKRTRTLKGESGRFHTSTDSVFSMHLGITCLTDLEPKKKNQSG